MADILLLGGLNLFMVLWVLLLRYNNKMLRKALHGAIQAMVDTADGKTVIEKVGDELRIRKVEEREDGKVN